MNRSVRLAPVYLLAFLASATVARAEPKPSAEQVKFFETEVQPILKAQCYACHGPDKQRSGLRLDTAASALKGGDSGVVIVPGKSADSKLIKAVAGLDDVAVMPPKGERLSDKEILLLRAWIDGGAKAPANEVAAQAIFDAKKHWAFVAPVRPELPPVKNTSWVRNPIDRFILARLEKERIAPSPEADRVTLIRRLSLDLLGLPPTIADVDAFVADTRPDAYERLVDRLLASPHYGERWARHWLDVARYGEDQAHTFQARKYPQGFRYRDWLVKAFNDDMPYDRFLRAQPLVEGGRRRHR